MNPFKLPFIVRLSLVLISIFAIGYLLKIGQTILAPFFFAFIVAMLFLPLADFLEGKLRFPRFLSSLFSALVLVGVITGLIYFFSSQLSSFSKDIPLILKQFANLIEQIQKWVSSEFNIQIEEQLSYVNEGLKKLLSSSGVILGYTFSVFSSGLGFLFFFILFFVFLLNYRRILNGFITSVFNEKHVDSVKEIVSEVQEMTKKFIIGISLQVVIVSILTSILLSILGVKFALLLGLLTGLLNVIPYLGVGLSMLISCFIAFATGSVSSALYVALGYFIIHAIDGNLVMPFVVSSKVKINALFSFIGILVGEQMWGISGMFLCIPAIAIIKIIFERVPHLQPWGLLLGEEEKPNKKKKSYKISKNITIKEKD